MPCYFDDCSYVNEGSRLLTCLIGIYVYHYLWDQFAIRPFLNRYLHAGILQKSKYDKTRESLWKNAAVGTFFCIGIYVGHDKDWFMNPKGYFVGFPYDAPTNLRWYYMIYFSFWIQSVDFLLNITNNHYKVLRKDNFAMILHHFATIWLMVFSYYTDLTKLGVAVLLIHDINDLLLESAKICQYLQYNKASEILFAIFAIVWFIVRWFFYGYNVIWSLYAEAYPTIVEPIQKMGSFAGHSASTWYWVWIVSSSFLIFLLVLHIYWGYLIGKMVIISLTAGAIEKDIRSESEDEGDKQLIPEVNDPKHVVTSDSDVDTKAKRRRSRKAE